MKHSQQSKNDAWFLPRPKKHKYKGGMPKYAEEWIIKEAKIILKNSNANVLNLFCGMNQQGFRVDIKNGEVNPDLQCDAHELTKHIGKRRFDIILADPPYSNKESKELYGTPKINYKKWTSEATKVLHNGGLLIVYHKYIMPNPDIKIYRVVKRIFIGTRTYHLPRVATFFKKFGEQNTKNIYYYINKRKIKRRKK